MPKELSKIIYDVAVIGGGPAGLMAAGTAAQNGARVVLLEKNPALGRKLLLTGKGRCNLTNAQKNSREFIQALGKNGPFLFSALTAFGPKDTIDFFAARGVKTKVERGGRVFPVSDQAADVLNALTDFIHAGKVTVIKDVTIKRWQTKNQRIEKLVLNNQEIFAKNYILATGGKSYPGTGSTGDGYVWAEDFGHHVIAPTPALVPILVAEKWVKELEGLSLKNVSLGLYQNHKKMAERFGEALFTDRGLSGPIVLDISQTLGQLLEIGAAEVKINFKPALDLKTLTARVQKDFLAFPGKSYRNSLDALLPKKIIPVIVKLSGIDENKKAGQLTKEERSRLVKLLSEFTLTPVGLDNFAKAIVTAGGVDVKEIDPKTMRSKIISNLYFAGEIIDLNGPTGGYNLQIAFATGFAAGLAAAR